MRNCALTISEVQRPILSEGRGLPLPATRGFLLQADLDFPVQISLHMSVKFTDIRADREAQGRQEGGNLPL
jgi:hypothetical protein